MSEDGRRRANTDPALKGVPRELRPFARKIENPVKRPGDDASLDRAVTQLRELGGRVEARDPLFYEIEAKRLEAEPDGASERGIGNVRVYVAPMVLPGAEATAAEARKRRRLRLAVGLGVVGLGVAGAMTMVGRCGDGKIAAWARDGVSARVTETVAGVSARGAERSSGAGTAAAERAEADARAMANAAAGASMDTGTVAAAPEDASASAGAVGRGAVSSATAPSTRRPPAPRKAPQAMKDGAEDEPAREVAPPAVKVPPADPLDGAIYR
ncbi:hypothetical protein [Sorangium sp. So ce124]|uniref:hypothetical protein n=1 Tax=Sorangium sp. So ce124 TaxID=3133280 RepID=UPI003F61506C